MAIPNQRNWERSHNSYSIPITGDAMNYYTNDADVTIIKPRRKIKTGIEIDKKAKKQLIMCVAIAFLCGFLIMCMNAMKTSLNSSILSLEEQVQYAEQINNSIDGKILSATDFEFIEETARNQYGMQDPTADQYIYMNTSDVDTASEYKSDKNTFLYFLYSLLP
jgi:cell division protein FtsL